MKLYKNSSKKYNPELISMVRVMSEKHPTYGYKRITAVIKRTYNITLDSKTVLRYRQYLGIKPLQPKRQRKVNNGLVVSKIAPNIINRNFKPIAPNLIWSVDITYVSHLENISYYGNNDEAHQVYQFALPPLTLHTFISGDSSKLTEWAKTIDRVSDNATYFNFLASHDGIGMRPTEGILTDDERQTIFNHAEVNGGKFNMKSNPDGTESVYEMNVTYFDAIKDSKQTESENIKRFMAAHGILLSLVGVPAIYYNSLLGSTNYYQGVEESGINRRINRQKFDEDEINNEIKDSARRTEVINQMNKLLDVRKSEQLFNPYNHQQVLSLGESVVAIKRLDSKGNSITCLINITNEQVNTNIEGYDIITSSNFDGNLTPYQVAWIK